LVPPLGSCQYDGDDGTQFRKFNDWTDVTIGSDESGLFWEYDAWDDAVQDLDPRTGWKDEEWYFDNFPDPPLCAP
jgi:hypothetical protein